LGILPEGPLAALVDAAGTLELGWSLRGQRDSTGLLQFNIELPRSPESSLELDLPADLAPAASAGIAVADSVRNGRRRWHIELGGAHDLSLRLAPSDPLSERRRLALLRTTTQYEFSARAVDVVSQWKLDVQHDPVRQIEFTLDPGLRLISARYGEVALSWNTRPTQEGTAKEGTSHVVIELPEPVRGASRVIRLGAVAQLAMDERVTLPRIQPQGLAWQEGSLTLLVPTPFELAQLSPFFCQQSKTAPLPAPLSGESIELQCFGPEATADVIFARGRQPVRCRMSTAVGLGSGEKSAQVVADLTLALGDRFSLRAEVPPEWIIDSIGSVPENALSDWSLGPQEGNWRPLELRLTEALTQSHPLRLIVKARGRSTALNKSLDPGDLEVLRFISAEVDRQLLAVSAIGSYRVRFDGDELERLDPQQLAPEDQRMFLTPPRGMVVELDPRASPWHVRIEPESPRFSADVQLTALVTADLLRESYRLRCIPEGSPLERLLVHFTHSRPDSPRWSFGDGRLGQLTAQRLPASEQAALGLATDGETWEVRLRSPQRQPFELRAEREAPLETQLAVSLASLPEAASQQGTILVAAAGDVPLTVTNRRFEPIEPDAAAETVALATRCSFRYEPARETNSDSPPGLVLSRTSGNAPQNGAIVWDSQLDSRAEPSGRALHQAVFEIQNAGCSRCRLTLPEGAKLLGLWLDHALQAASPAAREVDVALVSTQKFSTITVQFSTADAPWGIWRRWSAPAVKIDLPVLARHETLWLPSSYQTLGDHSLRNSIVTMQPDWTERLFGPLARPGHLPPFDPTQVDNWLQLFTVAPAEREAWQRAEQLLRRLGQAAVRTLSTGAERPTWSGLVNILIEKAPAGSLPLLIDRRALADEGIWSATKAPALPTSMAKEDPLAIAVHLLQHGNLSLVADPQAILLTSQSRVALDRDQLQPTGDWPVYLSTNGPLREQIEAGLLRESNRFVQPSAWQAELRPPWGDAGPSDARDHLGWVAYRLETGNSPGSLSVVRRSVLEAAGWVTFVFAMAIGWWRFRRRPDVLTLAALGFAALALLVPAALVPSLAGALLGTFVCLAAGLLAPLRRNVFVPSAARDSVTSSRPAPALVGMAIFMAALVAGRVVAAEPNELAASNTKEPEVYNVFIPSDEAGKPTGARYQVAEGLLADLRRRANEAHGQPEGWLLEGANYQARLVRSNMPSGLEVAEFTARFDLQVFDHAVEVRIPLTREGLAVLPSSAMLDGRAVDVEWESSSRAFVCPIAEPGKYRLELSLRPAVRSLGEMSMFELSIPGVPTASLELQVPADVTSVEVPNAMGAITWSEEHQSQVAYLGAADRLAVRWPHTLNSRAGSTFDVEELIWLKVRPGSVVLDTRMNLKVVAGQLTELEMVADPRLRLLPVVGGNWRLSEARTLADEVTGSAEARSLRFAPTTPVSEEATFQTSFLLTGTSALGNLRVPRLEVLGARSSKVWLAVTVDPSLEYEPQAGEHLDVVAPASFLAHWGPGVAAPQLAFELSRGENNWSLATRPRQPRTTARQSLGLSFFRHTADVQFDAQLLTTDGYTFQHRLIAPPELHVESISVLEDGLQRAARWGRDKAGTITVFLTGAVTGPQQLSLQGTLRTPNSGIVPLPIVRMEEAKVTGMSVTIARRPAVLVRVLERKGLAESPEAAAIDSQHATDRVVAALVAENEQPTARIVVEPNHIQAHIAQAASLRREGSTWQVEVDSQWIVTKGLVDTLRFEVPLSWVGPFMITPPADYQLVELPGELRRHLIIRPREAVHDSHRLTITGPLMLAAGEPVMMPDVAPLGMDRAVRFFRLPTQVGLQHVAWETSQLKPAVLPKGFENPLLDAGYETLQATGPNPLARLNSVDRVSDTPHVRLADIRLAWHPDASYQGVATFEVEPADRDTCLVEMPTDCRPVQVSVDGRITTVSAAGEHGWRVPLVVKQFPQRIEVLFSGQHEQGKRGWGAMRIEGPVIAEMPTDKTLWTIAAPAEVGTGELLGGRSIGALEFEWDRLQSISALVNLPADRASTSRAGEIKAWYRVWFEHWRAARDAVRRQLLETAQTSRSLEVAADVAKLERDGAASAGRLGTSDLLSRLDAESHSATQASELWTQAFASSRRPVRGNFAGATPVIEVRYSDPAVKDFYGRLIAVLLGGLGIVGLVVGQRRGLPLVDWLRRWPHACGVILGLAWWLWLWPSVVGLLIVIASLVASTRSGFRTSRESGSTIVRISSTQSL
jgi:hypothetical protein